MFAHLTFSWRLIINACRDYCIDGIHKYDEHTESWRKLYWVRPCKHVSVLLVICLRHRRAVFNIFLRTASVSFLNKSMCDRSCPCLQIYRGDSRYTLPDTNHSFSFTWCSLRRIRVDRCCTFFIRSSGSEPVRVTEQDLARVPCQQLTFAINWYSTRPQHIPTMSLIIHLSPHAVVMDFRTLLCRRRPTLLVRSRFYPLVHLLLDLLLDSQEAQLSAGKCASNVAILYGADGISIWNRISMDHECDRQTAYVGLVEPSVESIQNAKFDTQER